MLTPEAAGATPTPTASTGTISGTTTTTTTTAPTTNATATTVDAGPYWTQATGQLVSGFDLAGMDTVANWTFYNGAEFPGASGSLAETTGLSGKAGKLTYNINCGASSYWTPLAGRQCGRYVAMVLPKVPASVTFNSTDVPTVAFDVRNLAGTATPTLRVTDTTGQTLQFRLNARPLENWSGAGWQRVQVPVGSSSIYWGGANDGKIHLPIKQAMIMAGDVALPSPPGDMEVDNFTYLPSPETTFTLKPNAPLSTQTFPASYQGRIGVAWHPRMSYAALDKAVAAGINVVRMQVPWEGVEVKGKFDFTAQSNIATELAKRNVKVLWVLDYGHKDHGGATPLTDVDRAAFAEYARRTVTFFKGRNVYGYEIWNEPNWPGFWPNPDPVAYAKLLGVTVDAIKAVDPTVKVVTGGIADSDYDYMMTLLRSGKAAKVDALGFHPYRTTGPETFAGQMPTLKAMAKAVGLTPQIWDTEWGYSAFRDIGDVATYGDGHDSRATRRQAVLTVRKVMMALTSSMPMSVIYNMVNDGNDPLDREHNFGMLNNDGSDKPAMVALRTLWASQNGRTFKGFLPNVPPGLHVLRWDGANDKSFAIWTDSTYANARFTLQLPLASTKIVSWDGTQPAALTWNKALTVRESDGPIFVTVPN